MIRIYLGQLGSGKSASVVREMAIDQSHRPFYTNLKTFGIKNIKQIKPEHIIKKEFISETKKRDGTIEKNFKFDFNKDYWLKRKKPLNIVWDEIHLTANSRASTSRVNLCISKFIAMARRVTGFDRKGYGHLIFIAQKERTIDVNIKELTNEIRYHIMYWNLKCHTCGFKLRVNSDMEEIETCKRCDSWDLERYGFISRVYRFNNWIKYLKFREGFKGKYHFDAYEVFNISDYFSMYDTHQMENMWDDYLN